MKNNRIISIDLLRIFAMLSVILFHTAIYNNNFTPLSFGWNLTSFLDIIIRYPVPLFFMISGVFFLDNKKEITIYTIIRKYILRIVTAFIFWATIYTLLFNEIGIVPSVINKWNYYIGDRHFWYIFTIAGLYLITPFLRLITKENNEKLIKYFLVLSLLTTSIIPGITSFIDSKSLSTVFSRIDLRMTSGYVFYFIAGYYIFKYEISKSLCKCIYSLGIISFIFTSALPYIKLSLKYIPKINMLNITINIEKGISYFYNYTSINMVFITLSIFLFFKNYILNKKFSDTSINIIETISSYSFGIYLIHYIFVLIFHQIGLTNSCFNPLISIILKLTLNFSLSFIIVYILKKIPLINKYIV